MIAGQEVAAAGAANVPAISVGVAAFPAKFPKAHRARAMHRDVDDRHLAAISVAIPRRVPGLNHHVGTDPRTNGNQVAYDGERIATVS